MKKNTTTFRENVLKVVGAIPRGQVLTYKEVATLAGNPRACQAVGAIMGANRSAKIPCHRVVGSGGKLGGFFWGQDEKIRRLTAEGVNVDLLKK
jgi:O-6-methylguanine DNA methyltransferase